MRELNTVVISINTIICYDLNTQKNEIIQIEASYKGKDYIIFKYDGFEFLIRKSTIKIACENAVNISSRSKILKKRTNNIYGLNECFTSINKFEVYDLNEAIIEEVSIQNYEDNYNTNVILIEISEMKLLINQTCLIEACNNATNINR